MQILIALYSNSMTKAQLSRALSVEPGSIGITGKSLIKRKYIQRELKRSRPYELTYNAISFFRNNNVPEGFVDSQRKLREIGREYGLNLGRTSLILYLGANGFIDENPISVRAVCRSLYSEPGMIGKMVKNLAEKQYIEKQKFQGDKNNYICLGSRGIVVYKKALQIF